MVWYRIRSEISLNMLFTRRNGARSRRESLWQTSSRISEGSIERSLDGEHLERSSDAVVDPQRNADGGGLTAELANVVMIQGNWSQVESISTPEINFSESHLLAYWHARLNMCGSYTNH